jgi:hypothetical protein
MHMPAGGIRLQAVQASAPAALAAVVFVLFSPTCIADTRNIATKFNHEVVIGRHAQWNNNCGSAGLPSIKIDKPPGNGKVFTTSGIYTISRSYTGSMRCKDKKVNGIFLIYAPRPGFIGTDEVSYQVVYHAGGNYQRAQNFSVRVNVTPSSK